MLTMTVLRPRGFDAVMVIKIKVIYYDKHDGRGGENFVSFTG